MDLLTKIGGRGAEVRQFIVDRLQWHADTVVADVMKQFEITRQAVHRYLKELIADGLVLAEGKTRSKRYRLATLLELLKTYAIDSKLAEDQVWLKDIEPVLKDLPRNAVSIWQFCFTEMFNNAIDHSGGKKISVELRRNAAYTEIEVIDDGVGIFRKIQKALDLLDETHAILELAKGKLTTDPARHTGQGIFFSSRLMDEFAILSSDITYNHHAGNATDYVHPCEDPADGTGVWMRLNNATTRVEKDVFDAYSSGDDYGFTNTVVPVSLARYGEERLVSRSQAKRLMARVDLFQRVELDFAGIDSIGQAFADEIFRVFVLSHPNLLITPKNTSGDVQKQINAAVAQAKAERQKTMPYD